MLEISPLHRNYCRNGFDCGNATLNSYLENYAAQDVRRNLSACYVLLEPANGIIVGYYTLSATEIPVPTSAYGRLPMALLGRLAIDKQHQHKGYARLLIADAYERCVTSPIPFVGICVDPKSESLRSFYRSMGFRDIPESQRMLLPLPKRRMPM